MKMVLINVDGDVTKDVNNSDDFSWTDQSHNSVSTTATSNGDYRPTCSQGY